MDVMSFTSEAKMSSGSNLYNISSKCKLYIYMLMLQQPHIYLKSAFHSQETSIRY